MINYEFEVWGASGAAAKVDSLVAEGGLGGRSKGYKKMKKDEVLYIYNGGTAKGESLGTNGGGCIGEVILRCHPHGIKSGSCREYSHFPRLIDRCGKGINAPRGALYLQWRHCKRGIIGNKWRRDWKQLCKRQAVRGRRGGSLLGNISRCV